MSPEEKLEAAIDALDTLVVAANTVAYCYRERPGRFAEALHAMQEAAKIGQEILVKLETSK